MKEKLLVSACLVGLSCRYGGNAKPCQKVLEMSTRYDFIPFCPEQAGGLPTPRIPCELRASAQAILAGLGEVVNREGEMCTQAFLKGARETVKVLHLLHIQKALLKEESPSCGKNRVFDGTFQGRLIPGCGITAHMLKNEGITIYSEEEIDKL
ncbi:MAG: DUF523 domain-containing protein [Candidatus Marinimicrobia bacterium]|nr:DUF523 domain-containing protein [Candidatus Neomarinimicrobiota bacterium]